MVEADLCRALAPWLKDLGWDVYQEVVIGGPRADMVATRGKLVWIVEAKMSMTLALLDQVYNWRGKSHYLSVVIPSLSKSGCTYSSVAAREMLHQWGVGVFRVHGDGGRFDPYFVSEQLRASFIRRPDLSWVEGSLQQGQKASEGGSTGGGYWTPFRNTCDKLREYVAANPGCSLKQAIDGIKHHYKTASSAVNSMRHWVTNGKVKGVCSREGKLYVSGESETDE